MTPIPHKKLVWGIELGESSSFTRKVVFINPAERRYFRHAYVLWFGEHSPTRLHIFADSLDDALEGCAEWLAAHAPGLIAKTDSEEYAELMTEACTQRGLAWPPPKGADLDPYWEAEQLAMGDHTYTASGFIPSWAWGIALEDPTGQALRNYVLGA